MDEDKRKKLEALGPEKLATALFDLSLHDARAGDVVERLISTPDDIVKSFKSKLSGLKRSRRFIPWGDSAQFAKELRFVLKDLQESVRDPCLGAKLVADFCETDQASIERCDDSSGHVGDVYQYDAAEAFSAYAIHCDDKALLVKLLLDLNKNDEFGIRVALIDRAQEFLSEALIRDLVISLEELSERETEPYRRRHWLHCVESLAMQIRDPGMFEKARLASHEKISTSTCIDIAQAYVAAGNAAVALNWLEQVSQDERFMADNRERLLLEVYGMLGNIEGQREVAWRIFKAGRSAPSFKTLLEVVGEEQKDVIIDHEVSEILNAGQFSYSDAQFLIQMERMNEAERYVLDRSDQINGDHYHWLVPMAEDMAASAKWLGATILYRALLDSILRRAKTKTYPHGAKYLHKLQRISEQVTDWGAIGNHKKYYDSLRMNHGKKTSFWRAVSA